MFKLILHSASWPSLFLVLATPVLCVVGKLVLENLNIIFFSLLLRSRSVLFEKTGQVCKKKLQWKIRPGLFIVCVQWGPYALRHGIQMASKFQRKPFWLATQLYPQNDWTGWQNGVNYDVCAQARFRSFFPFKLVEHHTPLATLRRLREVTINRIESSHQKHTTTKDVLDV